MEELFGGASFMALKRRPNENDRKWLRSALGILPECGMKWLLSPEPPAKIEFPHFDDVVKSQEFLGSNSKHKVYFEKMKVHESSIPIISKITTGQIENKFWKVFKKGRITSSKFGHVLKAIVDNDIPPSLIKSLTEDHDAENAEAVQWSLNHEDEAIRIYEEVKHVKVNKTGVVLHPSGLLGCSPDGIVNSEKILQVNCPFLKGGNNVLKELCSKNWFVVTTKQNINAHLYHSDKMIVYEFKEGNANLNLNHPQGYLYYHQIQGILNLTDKPSCDLFIWTPKECLLIPIIRDESWKANIEKLISFYRNVFVYSLITI